MPSPVRKISTLASPCTQIQNPTRAIQDSGAMITGLPVNIVLEKNRYFTVKVVSGR